MTVPTRRPREKPPLRRPTEDEIKQAQEVIRLIDASPVRLVGRDEDGAESHEKIPPLARTILVDVLAEMAAGHGMMLQPIRPRELVDLL